jgi:sugar lactone lactonase YvrE
VRRGRGRVRRQPLEGRAIARVTPAGKAEVWVNLPAKSVGNGIVFNKAGAMFVADHTGHNVLPIDPKTMAVTVFAHEPAMNQPNDLAIAADGTLYASDPSWAKGTGRGATGLRSRSEPGRHRRPVAEIVAAALRDAFGCVCGHGPSPQSAAPVAERPGYLATTRSEHR